MAARAAVVPAGTRRARELEGMQRCVCAAPCVPVLYLASVCVLTCADASPLCASFTPTALGSPHHHDRLRSPGPTALVPPAIPRSATTVGMSFYRGHHVQRHALARAVRGPAAAAVRDRTSVPVRTRQVGAVDLCLHGHPTCVSENVNADATFMQAFTRPAGRH